MKVKRNLLLCSWLSFFLLISVLPGNASVFAQQEKLALSSTQLTVREIFDAISSQLRYDVFYNGEQLDLNRKVKFAQQVLNLEQVLDAVANNRFKYTLEDRTIILTPLTTPQTVNSVTLTGQVTDQSNTPLPGVTVLVKGTKLGTSTDPEGNFKLSLPQQENTILIFSFIGMESQEVPVGDPKKPIKVILKETAENLKEVVVTGIFTRKKESFTGSASTYTASELKTAGTQNILQSLKTLPWDNLKFDVVPFWTTPYTAPIRTACRIWKSVGNRVCWVCVTSSKPIRTNRCSSSTASNPPYL